MINTQVTIPPPVLIEVEKVRIIKTHKILKVKAPNVKAYTKSDLVQPGDTIELEESTDNSGYRVNLVDKTQGFVQN